MPGTFRRLLRRADATVAPAPILHTYHQHWHQEVERRVKANDREHNDKFQYTNNRIKTSKYNILTFLPINLFEQFQRVANAYFLFLLILQLIPEISSLSWFTTIVPLMLVLLITGVKDATDDYFRHRSDDQVNNRRSQVLVGGKLQDEKWMNVRAGDVIKLENNQFVVADLLLISTSEPHGLCYIETAELDGETNLKVRQALPVTEEIGTDIARLAEFDGEVICEPPNNKLDTFIGTLLWKETKYSLNNGNMLLRGCVLRNTELCFGLVVFAGPDTKLMQNSGKTKLKRTSIDKLMNTLVLWIFAFLLCMGIALAIGNTVWEHFIGSRFRTYLSWEGLLTSSVFSGFLAFWSYIIILNTVVPISLYVSVEVIRLGHSYFINWDRKMFFYKTMTSAEARTTTLNEELGQIEYVFTDKTGTLTQNIMTFNKCSINGKVYGDLYDDPGHEVEISEKTLPVDCSFSQLGDTKFNFYDQSLIDDLKSNDVKAQEFFRLLSLCHTVMSEEKNKGELTYQAQSPDEGALVTAARNLGFVFKSRTPETITVEEMGQSVTYNLLAILDFNNVRKRMSVIVRNPNGQIKLYCKGADTILFERLHDSSEALMSLTSDHLSEFAGEGLRTLALAYKDIDEDYFKVWSKRHKEASTALENREEALSAVYEEIESDMMLLGATAIEDKLQAGVRETITSLHMASMKVWVLTGDKQETAMNIGYSCHMLSDDMKGIFILSGHTVMEVRDQLRKAQETIFGQRICLSNGHTVCEKQQEKRANGTIEEIVTGDYALIVNGHSLAHALEGNMHLSFLEVACLCKTVICCRVTPMQKAQVVELVKIHKKAITLAIGDGANDISMIKTAHIGVGISGQEGMQAVLASDYSFAQFQHLQRLLLVHGRWSYFRMCKFLSYFFYKNFAFTLVHFWFAFFCGFSAQTVYDQWFITLFNIVYTSLPVLAMGLFDQDVNEENSMEHSKLYEPGQQKQLFNKCTFFTCALHGIYTSFVLFFIPFCVFYDAMGGDGQHIADYQSFAVTAATSLVIVASVQIALDTSYWTGINHFFIWGSIAVYFCILFTMQSDGLFDIFPNQFPFMGNARNSLSELSVWLVIFLNVVTCIIPVLTIRLLKADLNPTFSDEVRYLQVIQNKQTPSETRIHRVCRNSTRRSGYAFAHQEGYGELITSGRNMRDSSALPATARRKSPPINIRWIDQIRKKMVDTTLVTTKV